MKETKQLFIPELNIRELLVDLQNNICDKVFKSGKCSDIDCENCILDRKHHNEFTEYIKSKIGE